MPETASRDAELLIADVEEISWQDLIQEMMPDAPDGGMPIFLSCSCTPCDPFHCTE